MCNAGTTRVNHIVRWNGSSWSSVGNGLNSNVFDIAISGGIVYAGGSFTQDCASIECMSGNTTAHYIAKYGPPPPTATPTKTPTKTKTPSKTPTKTKTPPKTPTKLPTPNCHQKPTKPNLKSPANNAMLTKSRPVLKWNYANCAATYKVFVKYAATGKKADKKT